MRHASRFHAALTMLGLAGGLHAAPASRTITIDGAFTDWTEILATPENVARDGDGSSMACVDSTDLDCPVGNRNTDLLRFAWTTDELYFYFFTERAASSTTRQQLYVYFDTDHDALMESGEPILHVELRGDTAGVNTDLLEYVPVDPAGDPLTDPAGRADGWTMPGDTRVLSSGNVAPGAGNAPGGVRHEGAIRWQRLGVAPGAPMHFHVSLARGEALPNEVEDNMGGPAGAIGDTGCVGVGLDGPFTASGQPGSTVALTHRASSTGNMPTLVGLRATSSSGLDLTWMRDVDGDGVAETLLATDALGDGLFGGAGDVLAPEGDSDGDGVLDVGILGAMTEAVLEIRIDLPANSRGLKETIAIEAWSDGVPPVRAAVSDMVRSGDVTISRDETRQAAPGTTAWIPHWVSENSGRSRVTGLSVFSARGWAWSYWLDPTSDGDPSDAVPLSDTDGDGRPDVTLAPLQQVMVIAAAAVPGGALIGTAETATVRVHENNQVASTVTDRVIVAAPLELAPDYLVASGQAKHAGAGDSVYFAHRLVNATGSYTDFRFVASCDLGWPVSILLDPDGDGRPGDAVLLSPALASVPLGGSLPLIVRVDVPPTGRLDDVATIGVRAYAVSNATVVGAATDQAVVALVRLHDDPASAYTVSLFPECSTVHARASGLAPSAPHRISWHEPSGSVVRLATVVSDALGTASDSLALTAGQLGGGFTAEIQGWSGMTWIVLDAAPFTVGDDLQATLDVATPRADMTSGHVDATLQAFNASYDQPVTGAGLSWRLLSPDRSLVLDETGAFAADAGQPTSRALVTLPPRTFQAVALSLTGITFPSTGSWILEIFRSGSCGADALLGSATIDVADDADLDGIVGDDERALGTDPADADSDDDGVLDGAEGAGDADADSVPDALECDADGDGLPDGLESGVTSPDAATAVLAGCFEADADPSTTTDPRSADSDAGGVPDGIEDADRDGAVDPGEGDPADGSDDAGFDLDADGLTYGAELAAGTRDDDADSDDDGLTDGADGIGDSDGDGRADLLDCDSDDDGLFDGLESGVTSPGPDTDPAAGCFVPDSDPSTQSHPDLADTDGGGVDDGDEDLDGDGLMDAGESNATDWYDDWPGCSRGVPAEVMPLLVTRSAADAVLAWPAASDPCVTHVVQSASSLPGWSDAASGIAAATWTDVRPLGPEGLRFYVVRASNPVSGLGP